MISRFKWSTPIRISDHAVGRSFRSTETVHVFPVTMGSGLTLDGFEEAGSSFLCGVFGLKSSSDTSLKKTLI